MPRPSRVIPAALAVTLVASGLAIAFGSAVAFSLALAFPPLDATIGRVLGEPVREEVHLTGGGRPLIADLYHPRRVRGALLLVHGLSPAGRRHPDLVRLARLLARHGQRVLVPDFTGLQTFRLSGREVDEIAGALRALRALGGPVGIAGFSFGAGPALLAAATAADLRLAGSFGGYADLRHVIGFITTGVHEYAGHRYAQPQEEYNRWKLLALLAGFVEDAADRARLQAIAERRLADPGGATEALEATLGGEGRRVLDLILNRRPEAVGPLVAGLPAGARQALDRLSPATVVAGLSGRLLIAHGAEDSSIPFTESLWLAERAGGRARAVIFRSFHHTGPEPLWQSLTERLLDGWRLLGLADALLAP
ncbi:MAG TPA: hypothetical protein VGX21_17305 [Methylomirabilota bacterium]|nr:hypothetical protein [Methylomirabilota bacterium]